MPERSLPPSTNPHAGADRCGISRTTRLRSARWQRTWSAKPWALTLFPARCCSEDVPVYGPGLVQQYIDYDPEYHYFNFSDEDKGRLAPVVLVRPVDQQRGPQRQPRADREGHRKAVGDRPRAVLSRRGQAANSAVGLGRSAYSGKPAGVPGGGARSAEGRSAAAFGPAPPTWLRRRSKPCAGVQRPCSRPAIFPTPPPDRRAFPYPPI